MFDFFNSESLNLDDPLLILDFKLAFFYSGNFNANQNIVFKILVNLFL